MAMSPYTGALLSATSTPLWTAAPRRIAAVFGALAMASGATAVTALNSIAFALSDLELCCAPGTSRQNGPMIIFVSPEGRCSCSEFGLRRAAVAALDPALDGRPDKTYHDLAEVVRCLVCCAESTATRREGAPGDSLERYNTVLSMVIGGEYPLAALPAAASIRLAISSPLASLLRER
jgi:hypothetical protein